MKDTPYTIGATDTWEKEPTHAFDLLQRIEQDSIGLHWNQWQKNSMAQIHNGHCTSSSENIGSLVWR